MFFKFANLEMEYLASLHPKVKAKLEGLDKWLKDKGYPELVVTHVLRSPDFQENTYWKRIKSQSSGKLSDVEAKAKARAKFSWHLVGCAADLRNSTYTAIQLRTIMAKLKENTNLSEYEILSHDVGRGEHIHVGYRDYGLRKAYESAPVVKSDKPKQ
jgi:hypothetical protein